MVLEQLTGDNFSAFTSAGTRLVFIYAAWAGPAKQMLPVMETLAASLPPDVHIGILDLDAHEVLAGSLTKAIPALQVYSGGTRVKDIVGFVPLDTLVPMLAEVGVTLAKPPAASPTTAAATPVALQQVNATFAKLADATREEIASGIRQSIAAQQVQDPAELEPLITIALHAVKQLPELATMLHATVQDESRPAWQRLGSLAGLLYGVAPLDAIPETLGAYGFLDDWIVMSASRWTYVETPDPSHVEQLQKLSHYVWLSLPPDVAPVLQQFVARMEPESMMLRAAPEAELRSMLAHLLAQPAPVQFVIPTAMAATAQQGGNPLGGWSRNANGAIWGSGDGRAMYIGFDGGGGVGMVNGKIVGGP